MAVASSRCRKSVHFSFTLIISFKSSQMGQWLYNKNIYFLINKLNLLRPGQYSLWFLESYFQSDWDKEAYPNTYRDIIQWSW